LSSTYLRFYLTSHESGSWERRRPAGKLKFGSTLDEAITVVGEPRETVTGKAIGWADGTLYKEIDGRKGYCYCPVSDKRVCLFFLDYKGAAIFMTRRDSADGREAPVSVDKSGRLKECADADQ
jgi:hypothetical protein